MKKFNVKLKDKDGNIIYPYTRVDQVEGVENINAFSSSKLKESQVIDGISFDGTSTVNHFTSSDTAAEIQTKEAFLSNFVLEPGAKAIVKFMNKNTALNPCLNINDTGAFPITYKGSNVAEGFLEAKFPYSFVFSGELWEITGGAPIDTSVMTITYW